MYNSSGTRIGSYTYDAWGNCTVSLESSATTAEKRIVRNFNPFRYRGYYYDYDTGLYYLQSRYYNPATGRFLNADGYVNANGDLIGFNMYAYCGNNPINFFDSHGTSKNTLYTCISGWYDPGHPDGGVVKGYQKSNGRITTTYYDVIYIAPNDVKDYYINVYHGGEAVSTDLIVTGADIAFSVGVSTMKNTFLKTVLVSLSEAISPLVVCYDIISGIGSLKDDKEDELIRQAIQDGKGLIVSRAPTVTGDPRIVNVEQTLIRTWDTYPYY